MTRLRRKPFIYKSRLRAQRGLTLLEVLVATAILAMVFVLSQQTFDAASKAFERTSDQTQRLEQIDKAWFLLKQDLTHLLGHSVKRSFDSDIPPLVIEFGQEVWLALLRGNYENVLGLQRSELQRVAYKLEDNEIVRYSWYDPAGTDFDLAKKQKLLGGVERVEIAVLSAQARNLDGPWEDTWLQLSSLPLAVEITLETQDRGEMKRRFVLENGR